MFCRSFTTVLPAALFVISVAQTYELAGRAEMPLANAMLRRDRGIHGNDGYIHLLSGLLRSNSFIQYTSEIPCDVITNLTLNGDNAKDFVEKIRKGGSPQLIQHLDPKIKQAFSEMIRFAYIMPEELKAAEAAVTGVVDFFNDIESGDNFSDNDKIHPDDMSTMSSLLADMSTGFPSGSDATMPVTTCVACSASAQTISCLPLPGANNKGTISVAPRTVTTISTPSKKLSTTRTQSPGKSVPTIRPSKVPANTSLPTPPFLNNSSSFSAGPSTTPDQQTPNLGSRMTSRPFESTSIGICAVTILGILGVVVLL
ncbi:hypothetical protein MMC22_002273 [Lobaria immixta]|nr:hypothetical protein [Lobaria immixta]